MKYMAYFDYFYFDTVLVLMLFGRELKIQEIDRNIKILTNLNELSELLIRFMYLSLSAYLHIYFFSVQKLS